MTKNKYPECEKFATIQPESQKIGEFLDWLMSVRGLTLCRWCDAEELNADNTGMMVEYQEGQYVRDYAASIQSLLAQYFGIDLQKLDEERFQILDELRKRNQDEKI